MSHPDRIDGRAPRVGRRRPTPIAVCVALAAGFAPLLAKAQPGGTVPEPAALGPAAAGSAASGSATHEPVRLRIDPRLNLESRGRDVPAATFGRADHLQTRQTGDGVHTRLEGAAELRRGGTTMRADRIDYDDARQTVEAEGKVTVEQGGTRIVGPRMTLRLDSSEGRFDSPTYELGEGGGRGRADRIEMQGPGRFLLSNATFSTCRPDNEDWRIEARRLSIDENEGQGSGRNASLVFQDRRVLSLPGFFFPVGDQRQSGFLSPSLSVTSRSGFEVTLPYYLNLAPNYDLTLAPTVSIRRGLQLGSQFRYLFDHFSGDVVADYAPDDRVAGRERYFYHATNAIHDLNGWSGGWNVKGVSDDNYFVDYSRTLVDASERSLPRDVYLTRNFGQWNFLSRITRYQNILDARLSPPYEKLPQLQLSTFRSNVRGFDLGFLADVTWFTNPRVGAVEGSRAVVNPSISYPFQGASWFFVPKASLHASSYQLDNNPGGQTSLTRTLPTFSLDGGVVMERDSRFFGMDSIQTLEPRLFYVRTPYRDQSRFPVFDSSANDFNFAQLFNENLYTGHDRIADSNQLTAALVTRQIEAATGIERLRLAVAQRFYFDSQRVTIPGQSSRTDRRSDILLAASGELGGGHGIDSGVQWAVRDDRMPRLSLSYRFWPQDGRLFNAGIRYQSDEYAQWNTSWQWPLSGRWSWLGKVNYSILQHRNNAATGTIVDVRPGLVEGLLGFEYAEDCWATRFVVQRFVTAEQRRTTAFFLQFDFRGLGRLGTDPFGILLRNIPGYRVPDNRSTPTGRYYGYE